MVEHRRVGPGAPLERASPWRPGGLEARLLGCCQIAQIGFVIDVRIRLDIRSSQETARRRSMHQATARPR
jgi:hypothetical protein